MLRQIDEIVEDSEPERIAASITRRAQRKKSRIEASPIHNVTEPTVIPLIELSDEDVLCSPPAPEQIPNVIEISDDSASLVESRVLPPFSGYSMAPRLDESSPLPRKPRRYLNSENLEPDSDSQDSEGHLNLRAFAYTVGASVTKPKSSSTPRPASPPQPEDGAPKRARSKQPKTRYLPELLDSDLNKVKKCVSCDARWTVRKSAAQKLLHMKSCAKKKNFSDDTMKILLLKEVDEAVDEVPKPKSKGRNRSPVSSPPQAKTFFEDVVDEAGPKRKPRRPKLTDGLLTAAASRGTILGRAKAIIGDVLRSDDEDEVHTGTQAVIAGQPLPWGIPATQAFGESALGKTTSRGPLFDHDDMEGNSEADAPPATQPFLPSKFMTTGNRRSPSNNGSGSEVEILVTETAPRSSAKGRAPSPTKSLPDSSRFSPQLPVDRTSPLDDTLWNDYGRNNDDAYMHFDPAVDEPSGHRQASDPFAAVVPEVLPAKKARRRNGKSPSKVLQVASPPPTPSPTKSQVAAKTKRKGKGKAVTSDEDFGEQWCQNVKEKILKDQELHRRILRYEPIHFDSFTALLEEESTLRLRFHLRRFLDQLGINHHGGEPSIRTRYWPKT